MAKKIYAVRAGRIPGIYVSWAECQKQVSGFSGAEFKGFATREEAECYLKGEQAKSAKDTQAAADTEAVAYVDGSYQPEIGDFSCGVVLFHQGEEHHFSRRFQDRELAAMRNVAGEIEGAKLAMQYCLEHNIASVAIYHDYEGIAKWCTGAWEAKKEGTRQYRDFYLQAKKQLEIQFIKVKGHSGDTYNELADQLAKKALEEPTP